MFSATSKPVLVYLLCVMILVASVDRVPDPPVVKPYQDAAAALHMSGEHQPNPDQQRNFEQVHFDMTSGALWFGWTDPSETKQPLPFIFRLNQAADSSPPALAI